MASSARYLLTTLGGERCLLATYLLTTLGGERCLPTYVLTTLGGERHRGRALLAPRLLHHPAAPGGRTVARRVRRAAARPRSTRGGAVGAWAMSKIKADSMWVTCGWPARPDWPYGVLELADWPKVGVP